MVALPPGAADSALSRVETPFFSFVCVPALLAERLNEPRPGGGGKEVSLIGALCGGGRGESPTRWADFGEWMFFFPPCLFPAGWRGVVGLTGE